MNESVSGWILIFEFRMQKVIKSHQQDGLCNLSNGNAIKWFLFPFKHHQDGLCNLSNGNAIKWFLFPFKHHRFIHTMGYLSTLSFTIACYLEFGKELLSLIWHGLIFHKNSWVWNLEFDKSSCSWQATKKHWTLFSNICLAFANIEYQNWDSCRNNSPGFVTCRERLWVWASSHCYQIGNQQCFWSSPSCWRKHNTLTQCSHCTLSGYYGLGNQHPNAGYQT